MRWALVLLLAACGESGPTGPVVTGTIRTTAGEPVPDAAVEIQDLHSPIPVRGTTDGNGRFALALISRGSLQITVRHPALGKPHIELLDKALDDVMVYVRPVATVHGRVVDERGAPMKGADVVVRTSRSRKVQTTTDDAGRYEAAAPRGHSVERLEAAAATPGRFPRAVGSARKETLLGQPRYAMPDIVLTFVGLAQGRVVSLDGRPVAGADVRISSIDVNLEAIGYNEIPERLAELGRYGAGSHYVDDPFDPGKPLVAEER